MIRTVALALPLALVFIACAPVNGGAWKGGLSVRFGVTLFGYGTSAFIPLPQSTADAINKKWKLIAGHPGPAEYQSLSLWCPENDYTVCVFIDDTDYIAGIQVALNEETYTDSIYDWVVQGFTAWTVELDGNTVNYWTIQQYFITPETLATDPATRVAQRNPDLLLQDHSIVVPGFNGELYRISTNVSDVTGPNSDFTKQACIPSMGRHYYYNMTKETECKADTLFPWFPLVDSNQLIGLGMVAFGKHTVKKGQTDYFEKPDKPAVKAIVPRGPDCLYELADSPGLVTMHTYYIKRPYAITCIF